MGQGVKEKTRVIRKHGRWFELGPAEKYAGMWQCVADTGEVHFAPTALAAWKGWWMVWG